MDQPLTTQKNKQDRDGLTVPPSKHHKIPLCNIASCYYKPGLSSFEATVQTFPNHYCESLKIIKICWWPFNTRQANHSNSLWLQSAAIYLKYDWSLSYFYLSFPFFLLVFIFKIFYLACNLQPESHKVKAKLIRFQSYFSLFRKFTHVNLDHHSILLSQLFLYRTS